MAALSPSVPSERASIQQGRQVVYWLKDRRRTSVKYDWKGQEKGLYGAKQFLLSI